MTKKTARGEKNKNTRKLFELMQLFVGNNIPWMNVLIRIKKTKNKATKTRKIRRRVFYIKFGYKIGMFQDTLEKKNNKKISQCQSEEEKGHQSVGLTETKKNTQNTRGECKVKNKIAIFE